MRLRVKPGMRNGHDGRRFLHYGRNDKKESVEMTVIREIPDQVGNDKKERS